MVARKYLCQTVSECMSTYEVTVPNHPIIANLYFSPASTCTKPSQRYDQRKSMTKYGSYNCRKAKIALCTWARSLLESPQSLIQQTKPENYQKYNFLINSHLKAMPQNNIVQHTFSVWQMSVCYGRKKQALLYGWNCWQMKAGQSPYTTHETC